MEAAGSPGAVEAAHSLVGRAGGSPADTAEGGTGNAVGEEGEEGILDTHDTAAAGTVGTVEEEDTVDMGSRVHPYTVKDIVGELQLGIVGIAVGIVGLGSYSNPEEEEELGEAYLRTREGPGCRAGWSQCCNHPLPPVAVAAPEPPGCSSAAPSLEQTSSSPRPFETLASVYLESRSASGLRKPRHSSSPSSWTLLSHLLLHLW